MVATKLKQIAIDEINYLALKQLGGAGDSFNDVIREVLKKVKNDHREVTDINR